MVWHNGYATCANVHISLASRDKFLRALYSYAAGHVACLNGRCDGRGDVRYECRIRIAMESMMLRFWLHSLLVTPCLVSLLVALPASAADPPARSQSSPVTVMDNQGRVLKTLQDPPSKEALAAKAAEDLAGDTLLCRGAGHRHRAARGGLGNSDGLSAVPHRQCLEHRDRHAAGRRQLERVRGYHRRDQDLASRLWNCL